MIKNPPIVHCLVCSKRIVWNEAFEYPFMCYNCQLDFQFKKFVKDLSLNPPKKIFEAEPISKEEFEGILADIEENPNLYSKEDLAGMFNVNYDSSTKPAMSQFQHVQHLPDNVESICDICGNKGTERCDICPEAE